MQQLQQLIPHEIKYRLTNNGGMFDIQKILSKQRLFTSTDRKGELHLPNICGKNVHSFVGPNTSLYTINPDKTINDREPRLNDDGSVITEPICKIDDLALIHDKKYFNIESQDISDNEKIDLKHSADDEMIRDLENLDLKTYPQKLERFIVKTLLKMKVKFGMSIDEAEEITNQLN